MKGSNILVAYDGSSTSKRAIEKAVLLAKENKQIELHILTVLNYPGHEFQSYIYQYQCITEAFDNLYNNIRKDVNELLKELPNKKRIAVLKGHVSSSIIDYAKEHNIDLIIMGSRGLGGFQQFLLGSVSFHVVQKAPCQVYIVKETASAMQKTVSV